MDHIKQLAMCLDDAEIDADPIPFIKARYPDIDWDQARAIARQNDARRLARGETQIGYKLGWTSEAMRQALGVERPNWGTLWNSNHWSSMAISNALIHPKVEPELVFRTYHALEGDIDAGDVFAAGGQWALGIEVVDPRFPSYNFDPLDNTADNSSRAGVAMGDFEPLSEQELATTTVSLTLGSETRTGHSSQAMGSPAEAVAWLVRQLHSEGSRLPAGSIVFTGGLTAPFDAQAGHSYTVHSETLPSVSLEFV